MVVDVAVVADFASVAEGGKLNVMGIFDRIEAPAFPTAHAFMVLALRLRLDFEDRDKAHAMEIGLFDEDGRQWGGAKGEIKVGSIAAGNREIVSQIIAFAGIIFPHAGEYAFSLKWSGQEAARVPLTLAIRAPHSPADPSAGK